jgi:hypothetical protein
MPCLGGSTKVAAWAAVTASEIYPDTVTYRELSGNEVPGAGGVGIETPVVQGGAWP